MKHKPLLIHYVLIALLAGILAGLFVQWGLSYQALSTVLRSPLSWVEKADFFWDGYKSNYRDVVTLRGLGGVLFSWFAGLNVALMVFVLRHRPKDSAGPQGTKASSSALLLGVFSTGCVTCGTSILSPLVLSLGASSTAALQDLSTLFLWFSVLLLGASVYRLAQIAWRIYRAF